MTTKEALALILKCQREQRYVVKDEAEKQSLSKALKQVFEMNVDTYLMKIVIDNTAH